MFIVECYLIAIVFLTLVVGMTIGIYDGFPFKWINTMCKIILISLVVLLMVSGVAVAVAVILRGEL